MICRWCKGARHRDERGRFVSREPACPHTRTFEYQHAKAVFYESLEEMSRPLRFFGSVPEPKFIGAVPPVRGEA